MKINIGTMYTTVDFEGDHLLQEKVHEIMHMEMGVKEDGAFYSRAYRAGVWDGITDFYDMKEDKFHTGLLQLFLSGMRKLQQANPSITYEIVDNRPSPLLHQDAIDEEIVLGNGDNDPIILRDYQYASVKKLFEEQVGIINVSTGGGKCIPKFSNLLTSEGIMTVEEFIKKAGLIPEAKEDVTPYTGDISLVNRYGQLEKPSHITFNGLRKVREIRGHRGTKNTVTLNHPLLTVSQDGTFQWKQAKDIEIGDFLVGRTGDNVYGSNSLIRDTEEAYELGAIAAEGYVDHDDVRVPQCILESPKHIQLAFLSGYLESECSLNKQKSCIDVISSSYTLINQISLMLRNMGYVPTVRQKVVKGYEQNDYYILVLGCTDSIALLAELSFISESRKQQLEKFYEAVSQRKRNNKKEPAPFGKKLALQYADEHYTFEEVVEINDLGEQPTFDVCMPETHSFIADGIVNHNTEIAAGIIQQILPYLKRGERVAFFTHSKEIMQQSAARIAKRLNMDEDDIGKIGNGKFDIKNKNIVFVMIPTLVSALKDPKKDVKFTQKEKVIKMIALDIAPKFKGTVNTRQLLRNYIKNCKLTTKVWQSVEEQLQYIAYDNRFTDKTAQMQLNKYVVEFDKIMEKKAKKKYRKYQEVQEFMQSVRVMIADECLVGDTLVLKEDGGWSYIKDVHNGQGIKGGVVSDVFTRESAITSVKSKHTLLEGSPTHPTFVVRKEDIGLYKKGIKQVEDFEQTPLMNIKEGDYIPVLAKIPHVEKTQWTPEQLSFVAMIMAVGYLDKGSITPDGRVKRNNRVRVTVAKDKEWYLEEFIKGAKSFNPNMEVKHSYGCRGNLTIWVNDEGLKDTLENVFDIPRGKKSDKIRINEQIQYAPMESIKAFIRTYFSCEGGISRSKQGKSPSYSIHAGTVSKEFSQGISLLLKKFGIIANMQIIKKEKEHHNVIYQIGLGGYMYNQFMDVIGVMKRKNTSQRNVGKDYLVYVGDYVLSKVKEVDHTEVVQPVYDFTTTTHTFIANGALTHNCHHSKAGTWFSSLSLCENATYRVGLSGTVDKKDKMGWMRLQALFSDVITRVSNEYLINKGVSSKPTIRLVPIKEPRNIELINNYREAYKAGIVENDFRNEIAAKLAVSYTKQRPGGILISVREIDHGERIMEKLRGYGMDVEFIHGGSDPEHRALQLDRFAKGQLKILIASTIMDEGVDVKSIGCLILAAGGKSMRQLLQRLGRGLRLNGIDGNSVLVFDFYDQTNKFLLQHSKERINIFKAEHLDVKKFGD